VACANVPCFFVWTKVTRVDIKIGLDGTERRKQKLLVMMMIMLKIATGYFSVEKMNEGREKRDPLPLP